MGVIVKFSGVIMLLGFPMITLSQSISLKGYLKSTDGGNVAFANILVLPDSVQATSGTTGLFDLSLTPGPKRIRITHAGYHHLDTAFFLLGDRTIELTADPLVTRLSEITVQAIRYSSEDLVDGHRSGTTVLTEREFTGIPVLAGEADVIKTIQLLPGTVKGVEGSADLFVRGGGADQNLILLDGAPVYNASHLFGFLSVFNPSMLDRVEYISGGFPASVGGRLSSILNVNTHNDISDRTRVSGNIGLIASSLFVAQPLFKEKAGFWISARRTYIDQVMKTIGEQLPYFFYDLNGKIILAPDSKNKFQFSAYSGQDVLDLFRDRNNDGNGFLTSYSSGNTTQSFSWSRKLPDTWSATVDVNRSAFQYRIVNSFEENQLSAFSDIEDLTARVLLSGAPGAKHVFKAGAEYIRHDISPSIINASGTISELLNSTTSRGTIAHELAVHAAQELSIVRRVSANAGLRYSAGYVSGKRYFVPEPRLALRYDVGGKQAVKLSYSRMAQYMHRISNSAISTPADVWYSITRDIRPQTADQVSAAWQRFDPGRRIFLSAELYYKSLHDLVGYEEGTNLLFNTDFESKLIQGRGRSCGLELLARKESGKLTGWISYTLSRSVRQYDALNAGRWFPARYDRRHNAAVVAQYNLHRRWTVSGVFEFISGARFTPVIGQYAVLAPTLTGADLIPVFSGINQVRMADSHRLDLGIRFMSLPDRKFQWHWFAGVYNVYNRASPIGIVIEEDDVTGALQYTQPGLFGLLPFVSYGFKF